LATDDGSSAQHWNDGIAEGDPVAYWVMINDNRR
jgi:hypothetical protein